MLPTVIANPQAEFEHKLLGYTPEELPGLIPYMDPLPDQPLLEGAPEDTSAVQPIGVLPKAALQGLLGAGVPESLLQMPLASLDIGSR